MCLKTKLGMNTGAAEEKTNLKDEDGAKLIIHLCRKAKTQAS